MMRQNGDRPRLLVTGAGGFLGWNVCRELSASHEVLGVVRNAPAPPWQRSVRLDLEREGLLAELLDHFAPHAVLHLASLSDVAACERDPDLSRRLNVRVPELLARLCAERELPLAFTSSSQVFDGERPPYSEDSPVCPLNVYGRHKAEAEQAVMRAHPGAAVCRVPLLFGPAGPHKGSFLQNVLRADAEGRPIVLFEDEHRSFLSARNATRGLLLAVESKHSGILHLGGAETVSRVEFGLRLTQALGRELNIVAKRQADMNLPAPRPRNLQLDITRARALGFAPGRLLDELLWALANPFAI